MKTLFSKHRWMQIVFGGLFIIAGVLLTIIAASVLGGNSDLKPDTWLSIIFASVAFIFGVVSIMSGIFSLKEKKFSTLFPIGAFSIALGVALCYKTQLLGEYLIVFIGGFILTFAVVFIAEAVAMIFFEKKKFWIAFFFVVGAILTLLGVLAIIFQGALKNYIYLVLGFLMMVFGLYEIISGTILVIKEKKAGKGKRKSKEEKDEDVGPVLEVEGDILPHSQKMGASHSRNLMIPVSMGYLRQSDG